MNPLRRVLVLACVAAACGLGVLALVTALRPEPDGPGPALREEDRTGTGGPPSLPGPERRIPDQDAGAARDPDAASVVLRRADVPPDPPQKTGGRWSHVLLAVVDYATGSPIAGVTVFDAVRRTPLGTTGPDGAIALGDALLSALAFGREGWLVSGLQAFGDELVAVEAALAQGKQAQVVLVSDRYTLPLRLAFVDDAGRPAPGVRFSVRKLEAQIASSLKFPRGRLLAGEGIPPALLRAWETHVRYARLGRFTEARYHFGIDSEDEVYDAPDGRAELRLLGPGLHRVVAVSRSGQRTAETVQVHSADPPEHVVRLAPGLALEGVVLAADDRRPVPGAVVTVSPYQILLQPQVTGPDGRFSFGGLLGDPVHLDVRAEGFEAVAAGPFRPGGDLGRQVFLQRKRSVVVAGIVVEQGTNRPVEGAQVSAGAGEPARTDRTGAFRLAAPGESFLLAIEAPGFESYAESVDLGSEAPPGVFGLVPSDREAQLRSRLVARIQGRVVDRDGKPVAGAIVDLRPVVPAMAEGLPGRAIVRGGFPGDEARTQTDGDGRFTLFTRLEGGLVVTVHDEGESRDHEVAVVRGSDRQGLQIKIVGKR